LHHDDEWFAKCWAARCKDVSADKLQEAAWVARKWSEYKKEGSKLKNRYPSGQEFSKWLDTQCVNAWTAKYGTDDPMNDPMELANDGETANAKTTKVSFSVYCVQVS
jgi:hypothetical protein